MKLFLFLFLLVFAVSCSDNSKKKEDDPKSKICSVNNPNGECPEGQVCKAGLCEAKNIGCNPACDDTWQECNTDKLCVAKANFCADNSNCNANQTCNTTSHLCETISQSDVFYGVNMQDCANEQIPSSNVVYVSTTGNDTGDGSMASPFKTIFHATQTLNQNANGGTIIIRGGTYVETNEIRVRIPDVTIMSYPGEWAIIDRSSSGSEENWDSGIYLDVDADRTTVKCLEVFGGFYAISTETRWDYGDPNDRTGSSDIIIKNVKAHDSYVDVIKIKPESDNVKITYSEIYNSGPTLLEDYLEEYPNETENDFYCNAEGIDNVNADSMYVAHCYIHNICSTGLYFKGGAINGVAEYNKIENTNENGIALGFDTSPEFFDTNINPEMYESIDCIARYNLISNVKGAGIGIFASKHGQAYNNTIIDSASKLYHPIHLGIATQDWVAEGKRPSNINPDIHNNIIIQNNVQDVAIVGIRNDDNDQLGNLSGLSGAMSIDNNCYYQAGANSTFEDQRTAINGAEPWTGNFDAWKTHINGDTHSLEVNPDLDENYKPQNAQCEDMGI